MNRFFGNKVDGAGAVGLLILRVVFGLGLMFRGWGKIQNPLGWMGAEAPVPGVLQALAAIAEFGGGLAIILGLLTPLAAFGVICVMIGALALVHLPNNDPFVASGGGSSLEPALGYLAVALFLLLAGPGTLSFDSLFFNKRRRM